MANDEGMRLPPGRGRESLIQSRAASLWPGFPFLLSTGQSAEGIGVEAPERRVDAKSPLPAATLRFGHSRVLRGTPRCYGTSLPPLTRCRLCFGHRLGSRWASDPGLIRRCWIHASSDLRTTRTQRWRSKTVGSSPRSMARPTVATPTWKVTGDLRNGQPLGINHKRDRRSTWDPDAAVIAKRRSGG